MPLGSSHRWFIAWIAFTLLPLVFALGAGSYLDGFLRAIHLADYNYYFHAMYLQIERLPLFALALFGFLSPTLFRLSSKHLPDLGPRVGAPWNVPGWAILSGLFVATLSLAVVVNRFVLLDFFNSADEWSYYVQASIFAQGKVSLPASHPAAFLMKNLYVAVQEGKVFSSYFPGWSSLLAFGVALDVPWLVNPVLSALTIVVIYLTGRDLYDRRVGIAAAVICVLSPFFLLNSGSYFSHPAMLLFVALSILLHHRATIRASGGYALLLGLALGCSCLVRPYSGAILTLCLFVCTLTHLRKEGLREWFRLMAPAGLGLGAGITLLLCYNNALTGDPLVTPYEFSANPASQNLALSHLYRNPLAVIGLTLSRFVDLHGHMLFGSLLLIVPVLVSPRTRNDKMLLGLVAAFVLFFVPYASYGGNQYGPRYYHAVLAPLSLLLARGLVLLSARAAESLGRRQSLKGVAALVTVALVFNAVSTLHYCSIHRRNIRERIDLFLRAKQIDQGIVFTKTGTGTMGIQDLFRNRSWSEPVLFMFHPSALRQLMKLSPQTARQRTALIETVLDTYPGRACYAYAYGGLERHIGHGTWPIPTRHQRSTLTEVNCAEIRRSVRHLLGAGKPALIRTGQKKGQSESSDCPNGVSDGI